MTRILAPALLAAALAGCVDEPVSTLAPGQARVVLASEFSFSGMAAGLPIEVVRLTPTLYPDGGPAGGERRVSVDSNDDQFEVNAIVDLGGADSATVMILVELLSTASGDDVVEWSGEVGPVQVVAGEEVIEQNNVELIRGPIENRGVYAVLASGPEYMMAGTSHPAHAEAMSEGTGEPTIIWSSSDESIIEIEPVVGDSVTLFAHSDGYVWIYAGAGTQTDSFMVYVSDIEAGPLADVMVLPDSAVMVPGSSRTLTAFGTDSLGLPVSAIFSWQSLNTEVATVTSAGVVTAQTLGFTQIVVSSAGISDTADINVQSLPAGVDIMFVGGAATDPYDWFTPDNWAPARVPNATDVVYIPGGALFVDLNADAEIGALIGDTLSSASIDMNQATLTIHGDLTMPYIFGDSTSHVIMDAPSATIYSFSVPSLTILGDVYVDQYAYVYGDVVVDGSIGGAFLDINSSYMVVEGAFTATNTSIGLEHNDTTFETGALIVYDDFQLNGGNTTATITAGSIDVGGDFTVTGGCSTFAPAGGDVRMISDTASISLTCSSTSGNRFNDLFIYQDDTSDRVIELLSDVYVTGELYLDGGEWTTVRGNGHTFQARYGSAYYATFDDTFVEVVNLFETDYFYTDSIIFTGMTGETRPQVTYTHPGDLCSGCYGIVDVVFDPTSAGPYIEVIDNVANGDSVVLYMAKNPGDGPARTVTTGEAEVHWAGMAEFLYYWSGSGQQGSQHQPLPDSLRAEVVDWASYPVPGVTVNWAVTVGNGSVSPTSSITDANGVAATQFTLGDSIITFQEAIATSAATPGDTIFYAAYPFFGSPPAGIAARAPQAERQAPTPKPEPAQRPREERPTAPPAPTRPDSSNTGRER